MMRELRRFCDAILNFLRFIGWFIVYPLIVCVALIVILPSCIFLLIVRMSKIESDEKMVAIREYVIEHETCCQRIFRLIKQIIRATFMFFILCGYPLLIIYVIIPKYGDGDDVILINIGLYLFGILALQIFGTYRGLKSYHEKRKHSDSEFKPMTFLWNIGSLIGIWMILYELNQMALFAFHTIGQNETTTTTTSDDDDDGMGDLVVLNEQMREILTKISFFVIDQMEQIPLLETYFFFGLSCVVALILVFLFRFVFELREYAILKHIKCEKDTARKFYFHSFVGTIIYGHGRLENVSSITAKIVSFLSDAAFLAICEKLMTILVCSNESKLLLDGESTVCWTGKHRHYAAITLVLIGYYIPLSTMIAPMFDELPSQKTKENEQKSNFKKFISMDNSVQFVKPFISAITVTKCWMLITSTFVFKGGAIGTIVSQSIACFILFIFSLRWSFRSLNACGLTQNEPGFPFGISLLRAFGFFAALIGCFVEGLKIMNVIDGRLDVLLLFAILTFFGIVWLCLLWKYHRKFDQYDDDINTRLALKYDQNTKSIKFA